MENKKEYLSKKSQPIKFLQAIRYAVAIFVFVMAVSLVFFWINSANAQYASINDYPSPSFACQFFIKQGGFQVIRNTEHDCRVRNSMDSAWVETHFYDSGANFCVEITSNMGRIVAPQCMPISQTGRAEQQKQENPDKIVTPPSFQIKELQYDTLPTGKKIQVGDNERIEIKMPDGSLIQLDANATFTPVSDHEVQSVFGRYRYLWQPFHDGKCIVGQNLVRQECRKVKTPNAILGDRGTEFLVESDKAGTTVTVLDGTVIATDLAGKKTVEVPAGQTTFIKKGGLPEDPKAYDPTKIERWWEKKTTKQTSQTIGGVVVIIIVIAVVLLVIVSIIKKIFGKKKLDSPPSLADDKKKKKRGCLNVLIIIVIILILGAVLAVFLSSNSGH